ncbi:MAG: hypothetical protein H6Q74_1509 [Firmicutes bacterium]|nr:hypothetical protein [Bacillota bacterium]
MAVINVPASKSLTLSNKFPGSNIKDKKIMVGWEGKYNYYSYLFFDIGIIPINISLVSASLVLFKVADFFNSPVPVFNIYPLLKPFSSFTTYENACPIDLDPALEQEFLPFTQDVAIEINITVLLDKWLNNTLKNNGIDIRGKYTEPYPIGYTYFGSAYSKDNTLIPFIRVAFTPKPWIWYLPTSQITYTTQLLSSGKTKET